MITEQNSPTSFKVTLKLVFRVLIPRAAWQKNSQHLQHLCRCSTASPPNTLPASVVLATWWYASGVQQTLPTMHTSLVCSCKPRAFNDTQAASRSSARAQCLSLKVLTDRTEREKHHGVGEMCSFFCCCMLMLSSQTGKYNCVLWQQCSWLHSKWLWRWAAFCL